MEFGHDNVRQVVDGDRLSSLPDELIHKILSCIDMKFAVQTCVLSSRWEFLWTSMPCLNFSTRHFPPLRKYAKFVHHVLSHRNHQIELSSVKLDFPFLASQVFVRNIAKYALSHNVQQLTVLCLPKTHRELPPCLFSSQSLKHLTLSNPHFSFSRCVTPKTPWDFPALTTLHLSDITLSDDDTRESLDIFSKCVNLKNLTLKKFYAKCKVFHIFTPRLSNLTFIKGRGPLAINLIAPQLEDLTIIDCSLDHLTAPPVISSLCYSGFRPQLSKDGFDSLNKVSISLDMYRSYTPYERKVARNTIDMLQELHGAKYLTLNVDIVECLSSFPDLLSHHPSPFSNLISLTIIDDRMRKDAYDAMKQKEPRAKKAKQIASHMTELKVLINNKNMAVERKQAKQKANAALDKLMAKVNAEVRKGHTKTRRFTEQLKICAEEMQDLVKEEKAQVEAMVSKEAQIRSLLEKMPKRERTEVKKRYSRLFAEAEQQRARLRSTHTNCGCKNYLCI